MSRSGMSQAPREPIAVVGIGCRFPGASGVEQLWEVLREGRDTVGEIPQDRFAVGEWLASEPREAGKLVSQRGGIVEEIDRFDAEFFDISPREAAHMDPQQRILLEVAWEAFEDAGIVPARHAGGDSGVFVGMLTNDYEDLLFQQPGGLGVHSLVGGYRCAAAGRLSYHFDFRGPSVLVDASSSSSLLAVHLACQSLWTEETSLALAGGSNLILEPHPNVGFSRSGMLAADGRCKFGDAGGDGFVRSDGFGLVVLEPLSAARAAGRRVYATILGTAVNNDGASGDYMMTPAVEGQAELLRKAYARAGVAPSEVTYMEAHGTGTAAGDPVELGALGRVLGEGRTRPFLVGSIKTNLGHTEAAAGVAGLIKASLCLHHGEIPPSLHLREPNPNIPWSELPLEIPTELEPWPEGAPQIAAVSSFGLTGSNAHAVLAGAGEIDAEETVDASNDPSGANLDEAIRILPLSARSPQALRDSARDWRDFLGAEKDENAEPRLLDLCFSAQAHRAHLDYRVAFAVRSKADLYEQLDAFAGRTFAGQGEEPASAGAKPRIVFVFAGQGSQWRGMTRELMREPVFRDALERCGRAISQEVEWSLLDELASDESDAILHRTDVVQPTLFAVQTALAALWRSWGVEPDAVIGQSMGEAAAAHAAGALGVEDAARVICRRSALAVRSAGGRGAMASTELSLDEAREHLERFEGVSVAVDSGPKSTVLAGDPDVLKEIGRELEEKDVFFRFVQVDYASHSPQMDPLLPELRELLAEISPQCAKIPFYSTVEAAPIDGAALTSDYWARNLREPVLFSTTVAALAADLAEQTPDAPLVFLEVGPHPVVLGAVRQTLAHHRRPGVCLASLRRDEPEHEMMFASLAELYCAGAALDAQALSAGGRYVRLPRYPWQRSRYWWNEALESQTDRDDAPSAPVETAPVVQVQRSELLAAAPEQRRAMLKNYVLACLGGVLGIAAGRLNVDRSLNRLGMDSLMAVELRNQVESDLGVSLRMTRFLRGDATVLIDHLDGQLANAAPEDAAAESSSVSEESPGDFDAMLEQVDEMSEAEVEAMLQSLAAEGLAS